MTRLIIILAFSLLGLTVSAQSQDDATKSAPAQELNESMEQMKQMMDTMDIQGMLKGFSMDGQEINLDSLLNGMDISKLMDGGMLGMEGMENTDMQKMMEESMKMLEGVDMTEMMKMLEGVDMTEMMKMLEGVDMTEMMKMFEGMDLEQMMPPAGNTPKEDPKMKKI